LCMYRSDGGQRRFVKAHEQKACRLNNEKKVAERKVAREKLKLEKPNEWLLASQTKETSRAWLVAQMPVEATALKTPTPGSIYWSPPDAKTPGSTSDILETVGDNLKVPPPDNTSETLATTASNLKEPPPGVTTDGDGDKKPPAKTNQGTPGSRRHLPLSSGKTAFRSAAASFPTASDGHDGEDEGTLTQDDLILAKLKEGNDQENQLKQIKELHRLERPGDFDAFTGRKNYRVDDYFEALSAEDLRKKELAAVSRNIRNKFRKKYLGGEQKEYKQKKRQEADAQKAEISRLFQIRTLENKKRRENKERQQELHDKEVAARTAAALVNETFAQSQLFLIQKINGDDAREAKKARTALDELFPLVKPTARDRREVAAIKKSVSKEAWLKTIELEKEADEIHGIRYRPAERQYCEHFIGQKDNPNGGPSLTVSWLNPTWVSHHFDEKFVALVRAEGRITNKFVPVPVGSSRDIQDCPPPLSAIDPMVHCHYLQGDRELCLFYSFASALFHLGLENESESIRMVGHSMEQHPRNTQIEVLRKAVTSSKLFHDRHITWGQKKKRFQQFDLLNNISYNPTLVIPFGADGGAAHAFTVVGHHIFDSTYKRALHLTQESLDWCCNTPGGFKRVMLAIRFPLSSIGV
jgi:hypothetical protein